MESLYLFISSASVYRGLIALLELQRNFSVMQSVHGRPHEDDQNLCPTQIRNLGELLF